VGLVVYDVPMPEPLNAKRPLGVPLGVGLSLSPTAGQDASAAIDITLCREPPTAPSQLASTALQATGNPVCDFLPLLELLSRKATGQVILGLHGGSALRLDVSAA